MLKKRHNYIFLSVILLLFLLAVSFSFVEANASENSGIRIELNYGKKKFVYIDKSITPSNHLIAEEIYTYKINGTYKEKKAIMSTCLKAGSTFKNAVLYTMPNLKKFIDKTINSINLKPKDSKISFNPDSKPMFTIVREKSGRKVDEERLYIDIFSALSVSERAKVNVKTIEIKPNITAEDNVKLTSLRSRYSTNYTYSNDNRKHNIKLALRKINGTVLNGNSEFSFNKRVGKRNEANGFKEAKIIIGGKYENGTGGGVCQASTTLYNAVLIGGLEITSVKNHSLECSYEKPSFDAMVSAGTDLKFKNNSSTPIFIRAYGTETSAIVEVYGFPLDYYIERKSEIISRKEPPKYKKIVDEKYEYHTEGTESGTEKIVNYSHGELKSVGYVLYYDKNNRLLKREKIREDTYKSTEGLIAVAP